MGLGLESHEVQVRDCICVMKILLHGSMTYGKKEILETVDATSAVDKLVLCFSRLKGATCVSGAPFPSQKCFKESYKENN